MEAQPKKYIDQLDMPASIIQRLVKDSFITQNDNMIVNKDAKKAF